MTCVFGIKFIYVPILSVSLVMFRSAKISNIMRYTFKLKNISIISVFKIIYAPHDIVTIMIIYITLQFIFLLQAQKLCLLLEDTENYNITT